MFDLKLPEIQFALKAVHQATSIVRLVQAEMVTPALTKEDRSPVTIADFASQAVVGRLLAEAFPSDLMIAEEDSTALQAPDAADALDAVAYFVGEYAPDATANEVCAWIDQGRTDHAARFWTLDPIDGTKGFLRGDQYAVALALVENGKAQIGVLGCPSLVSASKSDLAGPGSLVIAVRGQGTWTTSLEAPGNYERLYVSTQANPVEARLLRSFESGHTNVSQIDLFAQALDIQADPVKMDSQAKYAVLAAGRGELMLRLLSTEKPKYKEKIWDQAAGSLVLEEAGGCLSDLDGNPLDFTTGRMLTNNRGILASNRVLHDAALKALRSIGA